MSYSVAKRRGTNNDMNKLYQEDRAVHEWYRFVLSFPPHLVRTYLDKFDIDEGQCVLDPFCGTGTVLVECKKLGIQSVGTEANIMAHFASQVKTDWSPDPEDLVSHARTIADLANSQLQSRHIEDTAFGRPAMVDNVSLRSLPQECTDLLLRDSISPLPLHKTLVLLDCIEALRDERFYRHERLALAKALVTSIGNLHFGPEVGVGKPKADASVFAPWLAGVQSMASDLVKVHEHQGIAANVHHADARQVVQVLEPHSIDAVITSPPYPNEKDYTRTTRLESVLLGFLTTKAELRALKQGLLRSNTRNVYKGDSDHEWVAKHQEIQRIAETIEARRIELGKTSGFERLYATVTKLYFGGMARHLADLRSVLRPGAHLAYVVGDQASYLRVMIRTGLILADIGQSLGYELESIDLFRTRLATATKEQLREEVVVFKWLGERTIVPVTKELDVTIGPGDSVNDDSREDDVSDSDTLTEEALDSGAEPTGDSASLSAEKIRAYAKAIEEAFFAHYQEGMTQFDFEKSELVEIGRKFGVIAKNVPDIVYTYRSRRPLPDRILATGHWAIDSVRRGTYGFLKLTQPAHFNLALNEYATVDIYNSIPELVAMYLRRDEQSLLTQILYNRLIDIFTGLTCFLVQNHYRSTVNSRLGRTEMECDALYVGVDRDGRLFAIPIEAKSAGDNELFGRIQVSNMAKLVRQTFPELSRRILAVKALADGSICIIEFSDKEEPDDFGIENVKRYRLIRQDVSDAGLKSGRMTRRRQGNSSNQIEQQSFLDTDES